MHAEFLVTVNGRRDFMHRAGQLVGPELRVSFEKTSEPETDERDHSEPRLIARHAT
jgi:hypothetical protein